MPETETQELTGVPDAEVAGIVETLKKNPRYLSHKVTPEGGGLNTIEATLSIALS